MAKQSRRFTQISPRQSEPTTSAQVEQTLPRRAEETAPRQVEQTVPRQVEQTRSRQVEQTPPRRVKETSPERIEQTLPKRIEQALPTPFLERQHFQNCEVQDLLRLRPQQLAELKKDVEQKYVKGNWSADDNGVVMMRLKVNDEERQSILEGLATAWKDRFGDGQGPRDDITDQIVIHILNRMFRAIKGQHEERGRNEKDAAAKRKPPSATAGPRSKKRKVDKVETTLARAPVPAKVVTATNIIQTSHSQTPSSQNPNSQDGITQDGNTHLNSAQSLTLKASTPLNRLLLSISRETTDKASGNSATNVFPTTTIDLALPSLHVHGRKRLEDIRHVSFTRLELLARQKLFRSGNEHEHIRFSYIDPLDGNLALIEDKSSLQVAIALFAGSGYWLIALKVEAKLEGS